MRQTEKELREEMEALVEQLGTETPPAALSIALLIPKIANWKNTIVDATWDAKVALLTNDTKMLQVSQARLKRALQSVKFLEASLEELNKSQSDDGGE